MLAHMRTMRAARPLLRVQVAGFHVLGAQASFKLLSSSHNSLLLSRALASGSKANLIRPSAIRLYSVISEDHKAKLYEYKDVKKIVSEKDKYPNTLVVDVREPVEYKEGSIPGAINVPFKSSPGALGLSPEEFEENFGFEKPSKDKELIFYCLAGVRSTAAEELANTFGYKHRGNYVGSYEDWVSHENQRS